LKRFCNESGVWDGLAGEDSFRSLILRDGMSRNQLHRILDKRTTETKSALGFYLFKCSLTHAKQFFIDLPMPFLVKSVELHPKR